MGMKSAVFAIFEGPDGYFGTRPAPDEQKSAELAFRLPLQAMAAASKGDFDCYPPSSKLGVGVYERGAIVAHQSLMEGCVSAETHPVTKELQAMFPNGTFVSFGLLSSVNFFAYTVIEGKRLRRAFGGAEDHIDRDVGEPLPEELPHFAASTVRDGMRYFTSPDVPEEGFDTPAYGETLTSSVTQRLFGRGIDDWEVSLPELHYFTRRPWWRFW
ncbi:MAG: hypothetical protein JWO89_2482 [Verrucomicrobiaceae bacterium]|nr:hypothetical protein [Verrucomicrobiaceae bacterium]